MARPSEYSQATADAICERLAEGESLRAICEDDGMPNKATVFRWLAAHKEFSDQYAGAREAQAETMAESILDIADEEVTMIKRSKHSGDSEDSDLEQEVVFDATAVARNRLRVDARKWLASKMAPKKYGDKITQELTGKDGGPLETVTRVELVAMRPK